MRILIVEDEFNLADVIASRLKEEKYLVDIFTDGLEGNYQALTDIYDLVILDVMLPGMDGFTILKNLKKSEIQSKIIMLTAKTMLEDKLAGFEYGADDYVTKPFHVEELVARINVQLRKKQGPIPKNYLEVGDLKLDIKNYKLCCQTTKDSINISCKEYLLIEYLMTNPNQIISKDQIYDKVWGTDTEIESNNLEAYLSFLRKKIKIIGSNVKIKAIRGLGYKLEVDYEEVTK